MADGDLDTLIQERLRRQLSASRHRMAIDSGNPAKMRSDDALIRSSGLRLDSLDDFTRSIAEVRARQAKMDAAANKAPLLAGPLADPRTGPRITDDLDALTPLAAAMEKMQREAVVAERTSEYRRRFGDLQAPAPRRPTAGNFFRGIWESFVAGSEQTKAASRQALSDTNLLRAPWLLRSAPGANMRAIERAQAQADQATPDFKSRTMRGIYGGVSSLAQTAPALAVSIALRNPYPAVVSVGAQTGIRSYGKYRARGAEPGMAALGGAGEGAVEGLTELIPMKFLVGGFGKVGFGQFLAGLVGRDIPTEQIATFSQDAIDTAIANPDKTWGEFLADRPGAAYETLVASVTQALVLGGPSLAAKRTIEATESRRASRNVKGVMEAAAGSKVRQESPEQFSALIAKLAEGQPGENIYVPAEVVRELFQSPEELSEDNFWSSYGEQISEAEALGGDVVIPLSEAATHLAGTPQWEAIKDRVRSTPGGQSVTEAAEWEGAIAEAKEATAEEFAAVIDAERAAIEPVQKIYEGMRDKLVEAGFTQGAASDLATAFAQRQATRAQRMGRELTGEEAAEVEIRTGESPASASKPEVDERTRKLAGQIRDYWTFQKAGGHRRQPIQVVRTSDGKIRTWAASASDRAVKREFRPDQGDTIVRLSPDDTQGLAEITGDELELAQSFNEGMRGRISFTKEGKSIIDLFDSRDLSTFIHESGHLYLEELKADAGQALDVGSTEARQVFADWEAVKAWFKANGHEIGEDGAIPTEAHELWARGFERFAMEGKAPSSALRRAFEAFRSWLLTIYKAVENLRAPLTPEIRDVMSRLLATDEEIAIAAEEQNIRALFKTAEEAGMTAAEFAAYTKATEESRDEAYDALLYRTMAPIRARKTAAWKAEEASVKDEVTAAIDAQPAFAAIRALRTGPKLSRQFLVESYGEAAPDAMPKAVPPLVGEKQVIHPDALAEQVGFESGDALVRALMAHEEQRQAMREAGDKRSPRQFAIDEEVSAIMAERHGDPLADGSIEEEARALIHNDKQGEVIAAELRSLSRRAMRRPTPYAVARQWAAEKIAKGKVADVLSGAAIHQYERQARKAGALAEDAMLRRDAAEAFKHKQAQMLNNALVSESRKARERVDVAVRRMGKAAAKRTIKSVDQDYLDQAHQLMEQVDFRTRSQRDVDKVEAFAAWHSAQVAAGHDPVVPDNFAERLGQSHWSRLPVERLVGLDETVQQILHLGRLKQTLLDGKERREREEVLGEIEAAGGDLKGPPPSALNDPDRSRWEAVKSKLRGADAAMIKIEQLVDWLDAGNPNGIFNRMIFKPLADAQGREADMMRDYVTRMNEVVEKVPAKQLADWDRRVETPELINRAPGHPGQGEAWQFYKDQIVMMALNWGNAGNRQRLLDGYGWSEAQVEAVFDRLLTAEDWQFVQSTWDTIDTLWPEIEALEKRVNGFAPEKVAAIPVDTAFGTFRGGYFPVVYDPKWSASAAHDRDADLLERGYTKANVRAGSTHERVANVKRPVLLSMEVITRHLGEVIHDITHREALTETWRLVSEPRVQRVISNALGEEYAGLLRPWLKHIANDQARNANSNSAIVGLFRRVRMNVTLVGLGYRFVSSLAQVAGMPNIIAQIGERRMLEGWARFLGGPPWKAYEEVTSKSAEMRDRFSTMDRDLVERARELGKKRGVRAITGPSWFTKYAFHGILIMDSILTTAGWIGAYRKATSEGMSEEEAIYYADKVVRKSQGSGGAKDQAAVMRDHEAVRVFTMFFSYFSALYNQQRDFGHRLRRVSGAKDFGKVMHFGFWALVMPPLVDALLRGDLPEPDDEDDEGYAAAVAKWAGGRVVFGNVASIPGIRELAGAFDKGFGYKVSPVQNIGEGLFKSWGDVQRAWEGDEASPVWVKRTLTTLGLVTGKPTGQIANSAQFGADVATGEVEPEGAGDWYEGLTTGRVEQ